MKKFLSLLGILSIIANVSNASAEDKGPRVVTFYEFGTPGLPPIATGPSSPTVFVPTLKTSQHTGGFNFDAHQVMTTKEAVLVITGNPEIIRLLAQQIQMSALGDQVSVQTFFDTKGEKVEVLKVVSKK